MILHLTLGDVEDELNMSFLRVSIEEIDTINPPIDIMELVKNEKFIQMYGICVESSINTKSHHPNVPLLFIREGEK